MFSDRKKFPKLADPRLQGRYPMRGLYQALAVASMCIQEEAVARPLIADVVTALSYLASQVHDPKPAPASSNKSTGDRGGQDERTGRVLERNGDGRGSGRRWEADSEKEDSPREPAVVVNKDLDRERLLAEAKMWGENWREKKRANAHGSSENVNANA